MRFQFVATVRRHFSLQFAFAASLVGAGLLVTSSHAEFVTVNGASGTNGASGATGDGTNGGNGGDATSGSDATAVANVGSDSDNRAFATGGGGGSGGSGGIALGTCCSGGDGGDGGWGGDANAVAIATDTSGLVNTLANSVGGNGGNGGSAASNSVDFNYGNGGVPGNGGDAHGSASATNLLSGGRATAAVSVSAGTGGGGSNRFPGLNGGDGGVASIDPVFASANNGTARASAHVSGGSGGFASVAGIGGTGASLALLNQVGGSTTGALDLEQTAIGGRGGDAAQGTAGIAGTATSWLTLTDSAASSILGIVRATGGHGGLGDAVGGNGADADSDVDITGIGTVTVEAYADGGNAGAGDVAGIRGFGSATANATTTNGFTATSRATATGRNPVALSQADTSGGAISSMSLLANSANRPSVTSQSIASVGGSFSSTVTGFNAMITSAGLPTTSDVNNQLTSDPNVTAAYNVPGGHTPLALLALGLNTANSNNATPVMTATASYSFDVNMLTGGKLMVGLLDPVTNGSGLIALQFTIDREGVTIEDQAFDSFASAITYFNDHVLDLGAMLSGVTGTLDLSMTLSMIASDTNTRFGTTLLVADVGPELLPGDYNDDGKVDAADYVVWRKLNTTSTPLPNDTNTVPIDTDQYNTWRANFGQSHSGSGGAGTAAESDSTVPEPHAWLLIAAAAIQFASIRRNRFVNR